MYEMYYVLYELRICFNYVLNVKQLDAIRMNLESLGFFSQKV